MRRSRIARAGTSPAVRPTRAGYRAGSCRVDENIGLDRRGSRGCFAQKRARQAHCEYCRSFDPKLTWDTRLRIWAREFESPRARHFGTELGTPNPAVFALSAATSVRRSTLFDPMMRSSF